MIDYVRVTIVVIMDETHLPFGGKASPHNKNQYILGFTVRERPTCSLARGQKIAIRNTAVMGGARKLVTDWI